MVTQTPVDATAARPGRTGAARSSLRGALHASAGVVMVIAADAAVRSPGLPSPLAFAGYSLLMWALVPVLLTLGIVPLAALAWNAELPIWLAAGTAGLATAVWVSWAVGVAPGPAYGLVLGLGAAGCGLVLAARWPAVTRVLAAAVIAGATAILVTATLSGY